MAWEYARPGEMGLGQRISFLYLISILFIFKVRRIPKQKNKIDELPQVLKLQSWIFLYCRTIFSCISVRAGAVLNKIDIFYKKIIFIKTKISFSFIF